MQTMAKNGGDAARLPKVAEFDFAPLADVLGAEGPLGEIWRVADRDGLHGLVPEDIQAPPNNGPAGADVTG
jgi:hypothetical protein